MNTEITQSSQEILNYNKEKINIRVLIKSYLEILRESIDNMNNFNYVIHFLYFTMMQQCNRSSIKNPLIVLDVLKKFYTNSQNISEANRTIVVIDLMLKRFQTSEAASITQESDKNIKTTQNEASCKGEGKLNQASPKIGSIPRFITTTASGKINFDLLPIYCIGNPSQI